jgi:predicted transcriptional regulator
MPIGLVSDSDFLKELGRTSPGGAVVSTRTPELVPSTSTEPPTHPVIEGVVEDTHSAGRSKGDTNIPESLRKLIGEEAVINGRASALSLAKDVGVSPSSVSAYAKGATSTSSINTPVQSLIGHLNKSRTRAVKRASNTLNAALGAITQEKLDYADVKDLSTIAKDMSVIIKNLEPPPAPVIMESEHKTPQFVIFAPQFRKEESFDVITVNE